MSTGGTEIKGWGMDNRDRGEQLAVALEFRRMTQRTLAERAELSKETIQRALRADKGIKPETWDSLARALDCWWDGDTLRVGWRKRKIRSKNRPYLH